MVILREGKIVDDGNVQEGIVPRRSIDCIVCPYWPMLCFVTFPLILFVSGLTACNFVFVHGSKGAHFDPDCAVVVVDFDHTCPWTGTAIGKGNMPYFQAFIVFLFICLIMDVILLTSSSIR